MLWYPSTTLCFAINDEICQIFQFEKCAGSRVAGHIWGRCFVVGGFVYGMIGDRYRQVAMKNGRERKKATEDRHWRQTKAKRRDRWWNNNTFQTKQMKKYKVRSICTWFSSNMFWGDTLQLSRLCLLCYLVSGCFCWRVDFCSFLCVLFLWKLEEWPFFLWGKGHFVESNKTKGFVDTFLLSIWQILCLCFLVWLFWFGGIDFMLLLCWCYWWCLEVVVLVFLDFTVFWFFVFVILDKFCLFFGFAVMFSSRCD